MSANHFLQRVLATRSGQYRAELHDVIESDTSAVKRAVSDKPRETASLREQSHGENPEACRSSGIEDPDTGRRPSERGKWMTE